MVAKWGLWEFLFLICSSHLFFLLTYIEYQYFTSHQQNVKKKILKYMGDLVDKHPDWRYGQLVRNAVWFTTENVSISRARKH